MNNAISIINNLKRLYRKTDNPYFAQKVENITGEYPDDPHYQSPSEYQPNQMTEDELIEESITNPNQIF